MQLYKTRPVHESSEIRCSLSQNRLSIYIMLISPVKLKFDIYIYIYGVCKNSSVSWLKINNRPIQEAYNNDFLTKQYGST